MRHAATAKATVLFDETASQQARLLASAAHGARSPKTPNRKNDWSRNNGPSVPLVIAIIWPRPIDKIALLASPSFPSYRRGTRCKVKYLLDYANERWKEADRPGVGTERFPTFSEPFEAPKIVTIRQPPTAWRNHRGPPLSLSLLLSAE